MDEYGVSPSAAINYGALGFPAWVDELCRTWGIDSSTYPNHQTGDRPDIGAAPNPQRLNRGIDWAGDPETLLRFAKWLVSIGPSRQPGVYGPLGVEMVIYQHPQTGERVWYPSWVNYDNDFDGHTDHVHLRVSGSLIDFVPPSFPTRETVPLTALPGNRWTSPSPAWAHLINRESGGNPTIIQQIIDMNSGGNEAEGLFQITPRTWRAHNGIEFADSPRLATPQQQAIIAARIFSRNPSGSDWGAGLLGREDPRELAAGLIPLTLTQEDDMANVPQEEWNEIRDKTRDLHAAFYTPVSSGSRYADPNIKWFRRDLISNDDGFLFDIITEHDASLGDPTALARVKKAAAEGDLMAQHFLDKLSMPTMLPPTQWGGSPGTLPNNVTCWNCSKHYPDALPNCPFCGASQTRPVETQVISKTSAPLPPPNPADRQPDRPFLGGLPAVASSVVDQFLLLQRFGDELPTEVSNAINDLLPIVQGLAHSKSIDNGDSGTIGGKHEQQS